MKWNERKIWVLLLALAWAARLVYASVSDTAPYVITDPNNPGSPLHVLDTSGYIQNSGCRAMTPSVGWAFLNSAGVAKGGFSRNGSIYIPNTDNTSVTAIALLATTQETTVTFAVAEVDTSYRIIGTLEDTATTTATAWIKRRNVGTFVIGTINVNDATTSFVWEKVRTTQ